MESFLTKSEESGVSIEISRPSNSSLPETTVLNFSIKIWIVDVILLHDFYVEQSLILFNTLESWQAESAKKLICFSYFFNFQMHSFPKLPARILPISLRDFFYEYWVSVQNWIVLGSVSLFAPQWRKISQCDCGFCLNFHYVSYKLRCRFTWFIEGVIMERQVIENLKCNWSY